MRFPRLAAPLVVPALLSACLGTGATGGPSGDAARGNAGIVILAEQFAQRSSVLQVLQARVVSMQVRRTAGCPDIQIRGRKSLLLPAQPSVYVDGLHTSGTCILETLNAQEVSRVEVYPSGVSNRPGYLGSNGGLILVFLKDGNW